MQNLNKIFTCVAHAGVFALLRVTSKVLICIDPLQKAIRGVPNLTWQWSYY